MLNNILPTPKSVASRDETVVLSQKISFDSAFSLQAEAFCRSVKILYGISLTEGEGGIVLCKDSSLDEESYWLDAKNGGLCLAARDAQGICYAAATALSCLFVQDGMLMCPMVRIDDRPDKDFRGLMVDLSSQWLPLRCVLKYVDACYLLKIKYLHLHFIDMDRYTLPSKAFPLIGGGKEQYTEREIEILNEYALARGVSIIPEFEAPGHVASLTRTYPQVFGNNIPDNPDLKVETEVGFLAADSVLCPGKKECFDGIRTLLTEMCEMFPHSPYIHIGGDEAAYLVWDHCPDCIAYMKDHDISDSHELYSEFVGRVARLVLDLGRTPIVWEGFPEKGVQYIPKETIVIAWESLYMLAPDLLKHGFKIINGAWTPLYIVDNPDLRWGPKDIMAWNVYRWQHFWDRSPAKLNPIHLDPTENVLGAQISSWGCTFEQGIGRAVEHLCALTERTWNVQRIHDDAAYGRRQREMALEVFHLIQER